MQQILEKVVRPTLVVNEKQARSNIEQMVSKAQRNGVTFRPHFKTHQSIEIGNWYKESGVHQITVSSVEMAEQFANAGWKDITIAFPVNIREWQSLNQLAESIQLNLLVESLTAIENLQKQLRFPFGVYLKIDVGTHRTGIAPDNLGLMRELIEACNKSELSRFQGLLAHAGHSYDATEKTEILRIHEDSINILTRLKEALSQDTPEMLLSTGDTPTCSIAEDFSAVDEIRPGNFVFYDLMQERIGSCTRDQISVAVACPVVATHPERSEIVIHGGAVHLSKESLVLKNGRKCFGKVVLFDGNAWVETPDDCYVSSVSQEHGIITAPEALFERMQPGSLIGVLPVHSCLVANLLKGKIVSLEGAPL